MRARSRSSSGEAWDRRRPAAAPAVRHNRFHPRRECRYSVGDGSDAIDGRRARPVGLAARAAAAAAGAPRRRDRGRAAASSTACRMRLRAASEAPRRSWASTHRPQLAVAISALLLMIIFIPAALIGLRNAPPPSERAPSAMVTPERYAPAPAPAQRAAWGRRGGASAAREPAARRNAPAAQGRKARSGRS